MHVTEILEITFFNIITIWQKNQGGMWLANIKGMHNILFIFLLISQVHETGSHYIQSFLVDWLVVKLVELGLFGCRINRGQAKDIEDIPEGYRAVSIDAKSDCIIVYIEPVKKLRH